MGWTGYMATEYTKGGRIDRLAECRKHFNRNPEWATILKDTIIDNVYYAAAKFTKTGEVFALIVLTDADKNEFFYKDMDETMHPYYFDCPANILDLLTPTQNELAIKWREKCREKIADNAKLRKQIEEIEKLSFIKIVCPDNYNGDYYKPGDIISLERYYDGRWVDWEKNLAFKSKTIFEMNFKIIG